MKEEKMKGEKMKGEKMKGEEMKRFVGIDLGKREMHAAKVGGEKIERFASVTTSKGINKLIKWLDANCVVALEAGNLAFRIARQIKEELGCQVLVLNPGDLANICNSLKKTDKEDALKLARLIQRNPKEELPTVEILTQQEECYRRLCTDNEFWKKNRTKIINRLHSLFTFAGITYIRKSDLKSSCNRNKHLEKLPEHCHAEAKRIIKALSSCEENIENIQQEINKILKQEIAYTNLAMSIPGIGPIATFIFLAYLGDGKRFSHAKQVSNYCGLVPWVRSSGDKNIYGRIIKGCRPIKRIMLQVAWSLIRSQCNNPLKQFYERLYHVLGKKKAAVALARKIVETFYVMCKNGELFRYTDNDFVNKKMKSYGILNTIEKIA